LNIGLPGKIALVTGGAQGIGRECCLLLADAGAHVIINYHKSKAMAESLSNELIRRGRAAELFQADVSQPDDVARMFEFIRAGQGRLDILVNNAGITRDNLLLNMDLSDWDAVQAVNLRGAFLCTKAAVELMLTQHAGSIINIASVLALRGRGGQSNYAASKGGLVSFTRACAVELGKKGIHVNAILPGLIKTPMISRMGKKAANGLTDRIALGRLGEPSDVGNLVVFLASDKADYITGQAIVLDGGLSIT
jgi:3-oxoacyl-[acyl-carrier protein] reductase